ncbi:transcription antitermination factor NusB [Schaalia sp. lx-100]|uniref:transcription antitermination factor NusB n=1 Tax=Schaalia sp. lx-100 TaxID=2899081 RepID=UPI001E34F7AB|nr:transcription antitermination factor NusB [Schaalia sp. lx-100]MCD4558187.1 16S rRNA methyltransferase [Schaalia sp. lx-100]
MSTRPYSQGYRPRQLVDRPRRIAYEVIRQVHEQGAYANIVLPQALREAQHEAGFDGRDAAFTSELVYGTLRTRGYLDWVLEQHMNRALSAVDSAVVDLLRMGAYQLLYMRVPEHAAVATSVDLAREVSTDGPAKFCNAVLRSLTRQSSEERAVVLENIIDEDERLAIEYSHPQWMVKEFRRALEIHSGAAHELRDLLAADNEAPIVTLVARPGLIETEDLADEAEDYLRTRVALGDLSPYAVFIENGDPARLPSIRSAHAGAQDEGSQLAAIIAAQAPVTGSDQRWLDLCAGPGGKTALLAALGAKRGAQVVANEVHPHRARLVERATRALDNVNVLCADGRTLGGPATAWPFGFFDRVLVDAPCSGMGSMRRRPESRWRRQESDVAELVDLQSALLGRAVQLLRSGGVLTYVTCSPHVAETVQQVHALVAEGKVELLDTAAIAHQYSSHPITGISEGESRPQGIQLWVHRHDTDLMYIAALRKL